MSSSSDFVIGTNELHSLSTKASANTIISNNQNGEMARIDVNGVFRVNVEPTDENTKLFIEIVNQLLNNGARLTRVEVNGDQNHSL